MCRSKQPDAAIRADQPYRLDFSVSPSRIFGALPREETPGDAEGAIKVRVPNPHRGDISTALLSQLLREASITRAEWEKL